jgi:hypothetical protein
MPASRRRTATKLLRLHPDELARITARAHACGLNPARFIRETALGAVRKARHHADTDRLLHALARLGGRLERAMRHVQSAGNPDLAEQLAEIRNDHHALVAQVMALRGPERATTISPPSERPGASPPHARSRRPASRPSEPSADQLAIDFNPGRGRIHVPSIRAASVRRVLASEATTWEES